jgi:predicted PolB exonuclease-like 3'-5' exonuclease
LDKDLVAVCENKHPKLLKEYLGKRVSLESMVILDSILQFHKIWNVKLVEDYVWKDVYKLMNDYTSFLKFDTKSFKLILKGLMNGWTR